MANFTKREKLLASLVVVLTLVSLCFSAIIWGPKILENFIPHDPTPPTSPTVEQSIKNAAAIFSCFYEESGDFIECKINKIYFVVPEYEFPFRVGDNYPNNKFPISEKSRYGDGAIVFFSKKRNMGLSWVSVRHGKISGLGGVYYDTFEYVVEDNLN